MKIGIAGGGVIGSLLAWRAGRAGAQVELFDAGRFDRGCSRVGAGLLGFAAESAAAGPQVGQLASQSRQLWREWLEEINAADLIGASGTLLVAAKRDLPLLDHEAERIRAGRPAGCDAPIAVDQARLAELEPQLSHFPRAYLLPDDTHLQAEQVLAAVHSAACAAGAAWHDNAEVDAVAPGELGVAGEKRSYDWVCDCRGMGAAGSGSKLRSVRGEILHLDAPEVMLQRVVRLVDRRVPAYIVPREPGRFLVGASEIESDDAGPITVRTALDLLAAACEVQPAFGEARIAESRAGRRPAYPDNIPALDAQEGMLSINGMYRHGYLAGPAMVANAASTMGLGA